MTSEPTAHETLWWGRLAQTVLALTAAVLLLWGLNEKYLWQDEAQTAVLATRLLQFGKPMGYDLVNLIASDNFLTEDRATIDQRAADPRASIDYHFRLGDFKADTTWKWHPWGQFVVAAASIELLGHTTFAARLPFALAGIVTVLLLYRLVAQFCNSPGMALLAAGLLVLNSYWILHDRQCRYYSLSGCSLVLTLFTYFRWQSGRKWGAAMFVTAAWCWFQVDYGTVIPVVTVLFTDALIAHRRAIWRPVLAGLSLLALVAPFAYYYELLSRTVDTREGSWGYRFLLNLFNMNEYYAPFAMLAVAAAIVAMRWKNLPSLERRLVLVSLGILGALVIWVTTAAPFAFLRYTIMAAPVGCFLCAWTLARGCRWRPVPIILLGVVLVFTPWLSLPARIAVPVPMGRPGNLLWRSELLRLGTEVFGHQRDPNRIVIEWLRENSKPTDEILINYEDIPLMYYLPNPVRGGIAAFRVEDDSKKPPEFAVLRRSVPFVHWSVFIREMKRYSWTQMPVQAPDIPWGNNPDPTTQNLERIAVPDLVVARRNQAEAP